jgi:5-aminolevulinate synthase
MNLDQFAEQQLDVLKGEGNYREFAELERHAGSFPNASRYRADGSSEQIKVWCSKAVLNGCSGEICCAAESTSLQPQKVLR